MDPGEVGVSGKLGLSGEIVQGGLKVLYARPVLQTFLKIEVPRRAVGMVDRNDQGARPGETGGQPTKRADTGAETMAGHDYRKGPARNPGTVQNLGAVEDAVLAMEIVRRQPRTDTRGRRTSRARDAPREWSEREILRALRQRSGRPEGRTPLPIDVSSLVSNTDRTGVDVGGRTNGRVHEPVRSNAGLRPAQGMGEPAGRTPCVHPMASASRRVNLMRSHIFVYYL